MSVAVQMSEPRTPLETAYQWRRGSRFKIKAGAAAAELERIRALHEGIVTPQAVVDASRPENAPLHREFEWRDDVAAERFRQEQARKMIGALMVVLTDPRDVSVSVEPTRVFIPVYPSAKQSERVAQEVRVVTGQPAQPGGYAHFKSIYSNEVLRQDRRAQALADLRGWRRRFRDVENLMALFEELENDDSPGTLPPAAVGAI
jgi:hypothetical protein